ncbi:hypothetical protein [Myxacorys almedinensis]|uniref:Uncharacterized protein n=1 Tax=Myxacorys almedinensis A TaxID=2690445 RepID=A0A8J7YX17_9CYAN|nr:hypothetical protein [Myxacorys almedinensis]NDJ16227.1 hypothetical protein [Myxacorys almedinensis A]
MLLSLSIADGRSQLSPTRNERCQRVVDRLANQVSRLAAIAPLDPCHKIIPS